MYISFGLALFWYKFSLTKVERFLTFIALQSGASGANLSNKTCTCAIEGSTEPPA